MSFVISFTLNTDIKRMQKKKKKSINQSKDDNKDSSDIAV